MTESFDFSKYLHLLQDNWLDYVDKNVNFPTQIYQLYKQSIILPNPKIQYPITIGYMLIPSALAKVCPLLIAYGESGSGKSLTGLLASKLHNTSILSSSDTFASIRNNLNSMKYFEDGLEKNCLMVWEDIDPSIFNQKPDIYRMLKYGIDRSTDTISIAMQNGVNQSFRVFSPKIISTISPIFNDSNFIEIQRRCMVIHTSKIKNENDVSNLLDIKNIDFNNFNNSFNHFWHNEQNCIQFMTFRKQLSRIKSHGLPPDKWLVSIDLLATLLTIDIEFDNIYIQSIDDAINFIKDYWLFHNQITKDSNSLLIELLKDFVDSLLFKHLEKGFKIETFIINPLLVEQKVDQFNQQGLLVLEKKRFQIIQTMTQLGYKLTSKGYIKLC